MIYIHVPFCRSFCNYCGFYSVIAPRCNDKVLFDGWAAAVCREAESRALEIRNTLHTNTLYIGGGTPSVLPLSALYRVVGTVRNIAGIPFSEFTIEINPEDIAEKGPAYIPGLRELGVNRASVGIQSFDDGILRKMARRHDAGTAVNALEALRSGGFNNISLDLIFGLPWLTDEVWEATLDETLRFRPEHISAYQLSVEEGSAFEAALIAGHEREASEDTCRRQYECLCTKLREVGYVHYEISNFALPGFEAVHNSAYWRRVPYVGLGPGAHSLAANELHHPSGALHQRSWNTDSAPEYRAEYEALGAEEIRTEKLMLSLRTAAGIDATELYSLADAGTIGRLEAEGCLAHENDRFRIPEDKFFVSDEIIRELL